VRFGVTALPPYCTAPAAVLAHPRFCRAGPDGACLLDPSPPL